MTYVCGCENEIDEASGVLHCVKKCPGHIEELANQKHDCIEYFESIGCLKDGVPQNRKYIDELFIALDDIHCTNVLNIQSPYPNSFMIEIGAGLGSYVSLFMSMGWQYEAIESSPFAARWIENTFDVDVFKHSFVFFPNEINYGLIFAAHVFEHMPDMPTQLARAYDMIEDGGHLLLIVPDDTDPINPDHWWFFNVQTLHALLGKIGFKNIRSTTRKLIERENFIYCVAEK